jgi:hypothetical protein
MRDAEVVAAVVQGGRLRVRRLACRVSSWSELPGSGPRSEAAIGRLRPDLLICRQGDAEGHELAHMLSERACSPTAVVTLDAESDVLDDSRCGGAALICELVRRCCTGGGAARTQGWNRAAALHTSALPGGEPADAPPREERPSPARGAGEWEEPAVPGEGGPPSGTCALAPTRGASPPAALRAARLARLLKARLRPAI